EVFVYQNRVYSNTYRIEVPWTNKQLDISYASYRDKAEPGEAEKWTVTVQGKNGENKAAELLTSMYDASLDQFKPHSWSVPEIWTTIYSRSHFLWRNVFGLSDGANENGPHIETAAVPTISYDHLAASAEEIWEREWTKLIADPKLSNQERIFKQNELNLLQNTWNRGGLMTQQMLRGRVAGVESDAATVRIRGMASMSAPAAKVDKKEFNLSGMDPKNISDLKIEPDGTILVTTINSNAPTVQIRKNFNETAFFFPQLYADSTGKYSFSFTMPEALTQWKWMTLAHTKDLAFGTNSALIVTQKKLMVQPNAPRFMREGDNMEFSSRIVNLTDKEISGQATLELIDATTNTSVDGWFQNVFPAQYFTVEAGQSMAVKFPIQIPYSFNRPLTWRIVARAGETSDGEENTVPVLTNRMLVTETLPLYLPNDTTSHFSFGKLLHNTSESLSTESLTVEYTSNPVWYAVQALPYLVNFPYECAEQTFNRFYANTLASFIINKHPKLKQVFELWRADSTALVSNLQKNEELKQILLQETPWVMEAESEAQRKKNLALLFDLARLSSQSEVFIQKLEQQQLPDGSFSWFRGGLADRYITNYILTGIGKLKRIGAITPDLTLRLRNVLAKAIRFMDGQIASDYNRLVKNKADLAKQQIGSAQIDYLYMRSFFRDLAQSSQTAYDYYYKQARQFWINQNSYYKAQIGLICFRNKDEQFATATIMPALLENTSTDSKMGMYWKSSYTGWWYQSPIEHQSMMIAFFSELNQSINSPSLLRAINAMKTWLLLNKQTNNWRTTIATADACYALLLNGSDWLSNEKNVIIQLGNYTVSSSQEKTEAGTGYLKKRIEGRSVTPAMGNITVTTSSNSKIASSPSWGSVYWQYFEDLDKITPAASPLSIVKNLFVEKNTDKGKLLEAVHEGDELKTGDKIVVRLELRSDRDMDYLHLKDMRAASMEPVNVLSGYKWQGGLGYYESTRDASTNFFISHLPKGTYVFEYPLFITHTGIFSVGIANIQCMYAPEFSSHSGGTRIRVSK
ncbi:MAG: alpha-2-macroglobulin, partial [Chitinophagaceae bacterium]|nr:alpha-2-macroglobulin [Chitinophagaceae bacterium]